MKFLAINKIFNMKYIVFLFFRYHSKLTQAYSALVRSIVCLLFLIYINILSIALFFLPVFIRSLYKVQINFIFIIIFGLGFIFLIKNINVEYLNSIKPTRKVRFHGWLLLFYVLFSLFFMALSFIKLSKILHLGNVPN